MAFLTIQATPGLSPAERRRAHAAGPPAVAVRTSYPSLLRSAGFTHVVATDRTAEYRITQAAWIAATERRADAIRAIVGDQLYDERAQERAGTVAAIDAGLLARFLYTATRR